MGVLAAKVLLAPTFVMAASVAARRYGARIGGLIGGLPVVAGPILLVFALDHGRAFAAKASGATLLGIVSLIAFIVVYARLAGGVHWGAGLILGWTAFFATTAVLSVFTVAPAVALVCALVTIGVALLALPRSPGERLTQVIPPAWDLPLRGLSALALVLALTALAGQLGAKLSGLLAPFPVVASVLAVFTHALHGEEDLQRIMRGFVLGLVAYALFCFALAESLDSLSIAASFAVAVATALATQSIALTLSWRRRAGAATVETAGG
ncbi:MAG TPA: hypothetical protein VFW38_11240 [Solirubrobacteraceae bacterium]|nr:hypothetical protein [Solirubrobacteraceae bacterium]